MIIKKGKDDLNCLLIAVCPLLVRKEKVMEKIYRVKLNSKGMPNFSTAVEIDTDISEYSDKLWRNAYERGKADGAMIYGNEHNCIMTIFGECSYAETGCGDCAVVEKVRKALSADRPQGHYIKGENGERYCSNCKRIDDKYSVARFCWWCGAKMKGADDE